MGYRSCRNCGFEACEDREQCGKDSKLEIDKHILVAARLTREGQDLKSRQPTQDQVDLSIIAGKLLAEWLP